MTAKLLIFPALTTQSKFPTTAISSEAWHREAKHFANAFATEIAAGNRDSAERLAQHALRCLDAATRNLS